MKFVIYPPVKELGQRAYTVQMIIGNYIDERTVPEERIDRYIHNIVDVCKDNNKHAVLRYIKIN